MLLDEAVENPVDLLNEDISLDSTFLLPDKAKEVIAFLKDKKKKSTEMADQGQTSWNLELDEQLLQDL